MDFFSSPPASELGSWDNVIEKSLKPVVYYHIPVLLACYYITFFSLGWYTGWTGLKLQKLAGQLSMYPAFFTLVYTSHRTIMDPSFWSLESDKRFNGTSEICDLFANFYIATNIVQAMGQIQTEKPPLLYQLMVHHVLSIACYWGGFYFDRFRWWTAFAGACEITNIFLVPVFASKEYFPEWRKETWFLYNSTLLWWSFVTHRLVLFPVWLGLWVYDRQYIHGDEPLHWFEFLVYPITVFGLLVLSTIWFFQIDRGLKKQRIIYYEAQLARKKNV